MMKIRMALLFVVGALLGSLLDGLHTHSGVSYYPFPWVWKMAWWVPLIMGAATLLIGTSHFKLNPQPNKKLSITLLASLFFFVMAYFVSAWGLIGNLRKAEILLVFYFLSWGLFDRSWINVGMAVATALVGSLVEGSLGIFAGQFFYTQPDIFGVPLWLPLLYANASAAAGDLGRLILKNASPKLLL